MINYISTNFISLYLAALLFFSGLFIGSEIRTIQFYKEERDAIEYINEIKKECNIKIAKARGL